MVHQRLPHTCKSLRITLSTHAPPQFLWASPINGPTVRYQLPKLQNNRQCSTVGRFLLPWGEREMYFPASSAALPSFTSFHKRMGTLLSLLTPQTRSSFIVLRKKNIRKVGCREPLKSCWFYITYKNSHKYFERNLQRRGHLKIISSGDIRTMILPKTEDFSQIQSLSTY